MASRDSNNNDLQLECQVTEDVLLLVYKGKKWQLSTWRVVIHNRGQFVLHCSRGKGKHSQIEVSGSWFWLSIKYEFTVFHEDGSLLSCKIVSISVDHHKEMLGKKFLHLVRFCIKSILRTFFFCNRNFKSIVSYSELQYIKEIKKLKSFLGKL